MVERILDLEKMFDNEEYTQSEFEGEIANLIFFSHVYNMTQEQACECLIRMGYEYIVDKY